MVKVVVGMSIAAMLSTGCGSGKKGQQKENSQMNNNELTMLVGTYTSGSSKGIYTYRFDQETGTVTPLSETEVSNPSYLNVSADGNFVYAVSENEADEAAVSAFAFNKENGTLRLLNCQPTHGDAPCYVITNGKQVVTANYGGGSITVLPLAADGSLLPASAVIPFEGSGPNSERQKKPHLHCVRFTPDGKHLLADDLGTDKIHHFHVNVQADSQNRETFLTPGTPEAYLIEPGSGPRHLTFSADGKFAYLINEISGTVTAFSYGNGELQQIQTAVSDTLGAGGSADIHISPDGRFLYSSNRLQADGIAIFRRDTETGLLTRLGHQFTGVHPRNFILTPNGKYLLVACRDSNVVQIFLRDQETGLLTETDKEILLDKPVCIKFAERPGE
ncbi:MAG: lactonase family protein [Bacteroides sp.]|nr:lactonase family protein [Bacteroides sp.]